MGVGKSQHPTFLLLDPHQPDPHQVPMAKSKKSSLGFPFSQAFVSHSHFPELTKNVFPFITGS